MQTIWRDVAVAWRRLRATPSFTFFSVLTLAMGIAAVTSAYVLVTAIAAPPSGVPDVDELITLSHTAYGGPTHVTFSASDFEEIRRQQSTMAHVAAFTTAPQVLAVDGQSHTGLGEVVSGNYFPMLAVTAVTGRLLQPFDDQPGAAHVAVLSHDMWQRVFSGRPDVVGRDVMLGGHSFEVVGVAPADFVGLMRNGRFPVMAWVSLSSSSVFEWLDINQRQLSTGRWLQLRARPKPGVTIAEVDAEIQAIGRRLDQHSPIGAQITDPRFRTAANTSRAWVARWTADLLMDEGTTYVGPPAIVLLMTAAALVLLVTCSNLANLIVARGSVRRHELALRLALGATRGRLIVGCMAEVLIITLMGTALAIGLTRTILLVMGTPLAESRGIAFVLRPELGLDTIGLSLLAAAVALMVGGVVPGVILTNRGTQAELLSGVAPTVIPRWRVRRILIAAQVMVSVFLLGAAVFFLGQVLARGRLDVPVDLDRLAVVEVDLTLQNYDEARSRLFTERVVEQLMTSRAIADASASAGLPFGLVAPTASVGTGGQLVRTQAVAVTPTFFRTAGIAVVRGDGFATATTPDVGPAAVVDTALARTVFESIDVVGRHLEVERLGGTGRETVRETRTIVGVVAGVGDGSSLRPHALYLPFETSPRFPVVFTARGAGDPDGVAAEVRRVIASIDPHLGVSRAGSARRVLTPSADAEALAAGVATILGGIGLAVVLAGLYGVLSYLVSRRTREIAMRLALGATPRQVLLLVIRDGLAPVVIGIVMGSVAVFLLRPLVASRVFGVGPVMDVAMLAGVAILMLLATAGACYFPALRAARVDPARALKQD